MIGFGDFGKKRKLGIVSTDKPTETVSKEQSLRIVSTDDPRLMLIDPTSEGFFDNVLGYNTDDKRLRTFIEAIQEVKEAGVGPFWKPIYDPSMKDEGEIFKAGSIPEVDHTFNFWKLIASMKPRVQNKKWSVGSEYQYYAFLVWLVNSLEKKGWTLKDSLEAVVLDSKELGHYCNSKDAKHDFEETGSREVCGIYDLANTVKLLSCTNEEVGGFWLAGGFCKINSNVSPLADLFHFDIVDYYLRYSVGWLVLS